MKVITAFPYPLLRHRLRLGCQRFWVWPDLLNVD